MPLDKLALRKATAKHAKEGNVWLLVTEREANGLAKGTVTRRVRELAHRLMLQPWDGTRRSRNGDA